VSLPIDLAFLRGIDLGYVNALAEEKCAHLVKQELVRVGIGHVEPEMIDELHLLFCHSAQQSAQISFETRSPSSVGIGA
jgi:hypothetical protein